MYLIQALLPLTDNDGRPFPRALYEQVRGELTERFGGLTAYLRSPAEGVWKESEGATVRDEIVIYEVMAEEVDRAWWKAYRAQLCARYRQEELVVRASPLELL
ncbi:MAG: hypothetical protein RLZZ387_1267 [Chloroflexota bacterium]|jgi:hypothetical protein